MMRRAVFLPVLLFALLQLAGRAEASDLVLKRAMLSSGGVGYFEYEAQVDGRATLGLDLKLDQVDDVLKSLVVYDSAGGVGQVELPGRDGASAGFAGIPPAALASPLDYLNALRGVVVTVSGPKPMTGRVLRAERMREGAIADAPDSGTPRTLVTLLAEDGLHQFVLEDVDSVAVADAGLRDRIDAALASLRGDARSDVRHLTLTSDGKGKRTVRVGYVAVAPLWKASYRLILPPANATGDAAKARLQGWAVLENATGTDWNGVGLSLQYGNPVTFHQAIYRAYYVERPEVPVQVLGRLLPDVDARSVPAMAPEPPPAPAPAPFGLMRNKAAEAAPMLAVAPPAETAQQDEGADNTLFTLANPVMLAAGHTAMVPILDRAVPAERIGLAAPGARHPTASVRTTNDAGTSLPAGVLTLYDASGAASYAGDARLGGLPSGEDRLLGFAEDLRTTLDWRDDTEMNVASITAAAGVLTVERRHRQIWRATIAAPAAEPRRLLLQIPLRPGQTLVADSGAELAGTVPGATRLRLSLAAGETRTVAAHADTIQQQRVALLQDSPVLAQLVADQSLPDTAKAGLRQLATLRAAEAARTAERDRLKAQRDDVDQEEQRLRQNLAAVPATDALHTRLIRQLDAAETRIGTLGAALDQAENAVAAAHAALQTAVQTLSF